MAQNPATLILCRVLPNTVRFAKEQLRQISLLKQVSMGDSPCFSGVDRILCTYDMLQSQDPELLKVGTPGRKRTKSNSDDLTLEFSRNLVIHVYPFFQHCSAYLTSFFLRLEIASMQSLLHVKYLHQGFTRNCEDGRKTHRKIEKQAFKT